MGKIILWLILGYILYRFVFNFLIPVITVSRRMKQGIREFQARQQQDPFQQPPNQPDGNNTPPSTEKAGEYIDFEEVKEK